MIRTIASPSIGRTSIPWISYVFVGKPGLLIGTPAFIILTSAFLNAAGVV